MSTPPVAEIARCFYPEYSTEVPSKAFTATMPLTFVIFTLILTLSPDRHLSLPMQRFAVVALFFLIVLHAVLMMTASRRHKRKVEDAIARASLLISIVSLDANFQMTRCPEEITLAGVPVSSTPTLTQGFQELRIVLTEKQLVAIAPFLDPLSQRFKCSRPN